MSGLKTALLLTLLLAACAEPEATFPAFPAGTYQVLDVEAVVARVYAVSNAEVDEVMREVGAGITASDEKAGRDAAIQIRDDVARRLRATRVEIADDGSWTWTPALQAGGDPWVPDTMSGRWTLDGERVDLEVRRLGPVADLPWRLALSATRSGRDLRIDRIVGAPLHDKGFEGLVLRPIATDR